MKLCKRCNIEKENIEFSICKNTKDGLNSWCKECKSTYSKEKLKSRNIKLDGLKICTKCNIEKEVTLFNIGNNKDGLNNWCRECNKKYTDIYYLQNKERLKPIRKKWMSENKDKFKKYLSDRYLEIDKERLKNYYEENKELIKIKKIKYRETEEYKNWVRKYRIKNSWKNRYRYTLKSVINRLGKAKEQKIVDILGYSAEDFKIHIEKLFTENMSWDKKDSFQVDHIIPISAFLENTPISIVNSLDNLRPLSSYENIIKSNNIDYDMIEIYLKYIDYLKREYVDKISLYLIELEKLV